MRSEHSFTAVPPVWGGPPRWVGMGCSVAQHINVETGPHGSSQMHAESVECCSHIWHISRQPPGTWRMAHGDADTLQHPTGGSRDRREGPRPACGPCISSRLPGPYASCVYVCSVWAAVLRKPGLLRHPRMVLVLRADASTRVRRLESESKLSSPGSRLSGGK